VTLSRPLRTVLAATPIALTAVLATAGQAGAGMVGITVLNPTVLDHGRTLRVTVGGTMSQSEADATARTMLSTLVGPWAGDLLTHAQQAAPPQDSACRVTVTVTDPDGATGTASAVIPAGATSRQIDIRDEAGGTVWRAGDVDQFQTQQVCDGAGGSVHETIADQSAMAAG
jgi:hypothetical protein